MSIQAEGGEDGDVKGKKKAASKRERTPDLGAMVTLHQWRDYIATQIRNLADTNVVPFYRSLYLGGDHYLPADDLIRDWPDQIELLEDTVHETLRRLKKEASKQVEPLIKSKLQYEEKDELEYLTCVEIEESDVPWKPNENVEMED